MVKIWINEEIYLSSECTERCEFGSFCEKNGSITTESLIMNKEDNKQLTEVINDCGHYNGKIITYAPTKKKKKRRF